jgi:hypothetical protein
VDRDEFATRLDAAARWARDYARALVLESLPDAMTFRLLLNQSNDDIEPLRAAEMVFPEDVAESAPAVARQRSMNCGAMGASRSGSISASVPWSEGPP